MKPQQPKAAPTNNQNSLDDEIKHIEAYAMVFQAALDVNQVDSLSKDFMERHHKEAIAAINKTIMESLPKSYLITPWKNIKDLPKEQYKVGYNQAVEDMTQQLIKKYGRADNDS